jgi:exonuclease SbcD
MRILHTADWHLGRIFQGVHLTEDQAHVLDQLVDAARQLQPDVVVLAGDVYDRAVPPPDAVSLFDDVLSRLALELGLPVVIIAGNHDSPERVGFGGRVLSARGVHVAGVVRADEPVVTLDDAHGPVHFCLLPYAEPQTVRDRLLGGSTPEGVRWNHGAALAEQTRRARERVPTGERAVAVAHAAIVGAYESESERPLWVGASGYAEADVFAGYCYAALGHYHKPQTVQRGPSGGPLADYPGSLLKYSFAEVEQVKGANLVEIDAAGEVTLERVPLAPRHDLRILEGACDALVEAAAKDLAPGDYLRVVLHDSQPVLDALARLRRVYPNVVQVEQPALFAPRAPTARSSHDVLGQGEVELFDTFFEEVTGGPLSDEERATLNEAVERYRAEAREATAQGPKKAKTRRRAG